ncbi:MAG: hypothetical protein IKU45_04260 [Clostridia bacterium]|nr:hypothetical protein [Clostridia bacterium]
MITPEKLNEYIEKIRNEKGEGKTQFYTNSGAGRSFPDNLKKGQMPSFDKVCMIAEYAGVSLDAIIGRNSESIGSLSEKEWLSIINGLTDDSLLALREYTRFLRWKQDQDNADRP